MLPITNDVRRNVPSSLRTPPAWSAGSEKARLARLLLFVVLLESRGTAASPVLRENKPIGIETQRIRLFYEFLQSLITDAGGS